MRTLQQAPSSQQLEIAFNVISSINKYKMQSVNSSIEVLSTNELLEVMDLLSSAGGSMPTEDRLKRISEYCGEIRTLVGIRNLMADVINKLQTLFIENAINEYPSAHTLVDTRKLKEHINIILAVRAAPTPGMSD